MQNICVIGSINVDLTVHTTRFPMPGETITGSEFHTFFGGKGANQAVACGRLGANVTMLGKLGSDVYAESYLENFRENGVDASRVVCEESCSSGIAHIQVSDAGENTIVVVPGANARTDRTFIEQNEDVFDVCDIFLFQLETPAEATLYAMQLAKSRGKTVILDPAPAVALPDAFFACADYITPNETELGILTGKTVSDEAQVREAAQVLLQKGCRAVIAKAGGDGAYFITEDRFLQVPGFRVKAVDTTAAGDTFNGAFAVALATGMEAAEGIRFACAAAAISVTKFGAQTAQPTWDEVDAFLKDR